MEGRMRKYGNNTSPERSKVWTEPPPPPPKPHNYQPGRKIPVVYYLSRNRHLEQPHFIEVLVSSPEGLFLRDVINRLNVLRGKAVASMYSWSCKRSYKNGFVWHDLSEDDLILPSQGNEFVLKGSELLDASPPDRFNHISSNPKHQLQEPTLNSRCQEASSSLSGILIKEAKPPPFPLSHEDEPSLPPFRPTFSPGNGYRESKRNLSWGSAGSGSPGMAEYRVYKANCAIDASTQTEDRGVRRMRAARDTCTRGVSTDDGSLDLEFEGSRRDQTSKSKESYEIIRDDISPPQTSSSTSSSGGKTETLQSLIRADDQKMNSFRILEEEEVLVPTGAKIKTTNLIMQLITCGLISVKDHHSFGLVSTYKTRFSHMKFPSPMFVSSMMSGEFNCQSENTRLMGLAMKEKEYFSGSLIDTKKYKDEAGEVVPSLKRSSSYNADRNKILAEDPPSVNRSCKSPDPTMDKNRAVDSPRLKCLPQAIKIRCTKQSRNETVRSPVSDDPRNSSGGLDCNISASLCSSQGSSKRITDASSVKGSSMRLESFKEEKGKVIKIEESLFRELGL